MIMKVNKISLVYIGLVVVLSSCFDDPGTETIFSNTFVELDAAGTASGEREYVYEREDDGVNVASGFELLLSSVPLNQDVTVNFQIDESSTAIEGTHFVVNSTSVVIPAGENVVNLPIDIIDDNIAPGDQLNIDITITSSSVDVASNLSTGTHVISIFASEIFFESSMLSGLESSGMDSVGVILNVPAGVELAEGTTFTFDYMVSSSAMASDFTITSPGSFTIPVSTVPDNSGLTETVYILFDLLDDILIEDMDSIVFTMGDISFSSGKTVLSGTNISTYRIEDDIKQVGFAETETINIDIIDEARTYNLPVTLSRPSSEALTLDYSVRGDGTFFDDITGGSISFVANQMEESITIEVLNEAVTVNTDTLDFEVIIENITTMDEEVLINSDTLQVLKVIPPGN